MYEIYVLGELVYSTFNMQESIEVQVKLSKEYGSDNVIRRMRRN